MSSIRGSRLKVFWGCRLTYAWDWTENGKEIWNGDNRGNKEGVPILTLSNDWNYDQKISIDFIVPSRLPSPIRWAFPIRGTSQIVRVHSSSLVVRNFRVWGLRQVVTCQETTFSVSFRYVLAIQILVAASPRQVFRG